MEKGEGGWTCIMNVAAGKVSNGMHNMPGRDASSCVRRMAGPPQELEFGVRSALKFKYLKKHF